MKMILNRLLMTTILVLGFGFSSAKAQFVVADPTNFAGNIINLGKDLVEAKERLEQLKKQAEQFNDVYKKIRGVVQGVQSVDRAYEALTSLNATGEYAITTFRENRFLSAGEKLAAIEACTNLLLEATNEIKDMTKIATNMGDFLQMTDKERIDYLDGICNSIVEIKTLADYVVSQYACLSQIRAEKHFTLEMFDIFNGFQTTIE